jgi:biopolymer transport protein ExbD
MPKVKIPRKGTPIDMTAMCDVAFLLLTFFILTTQFKADELVIVDTPSSISNKQITQNKGIGMITIGPDGKVFFGFDMQPVRADMLDKMAAQYNLEFTEKERHEFSLLPSVGLPINKLKSFLALPHDERKKVEHTGIPCDSADNELTNWILFANQSFQPYKQNKDEYFRVVVKGDGNAKYEVVKKVISTLQDRSLNRITFITDLEADPNKAKASVE